MRNLIYLLTFLFSVTSYAALSDVDRAEIVNKNILVNPGFENGKASWTVSGGSMAAVTSSTNLLTGRGSITWDSNSSTQVLTGTATTIPQGLLGRNGVAYCKILTPSGTATHTLSVWDGSSLIATQSIVSSTTPTFTYTNFIFPTSGTVTIRITAVASNEPLIALDDCFVGDATNLSNVSQASLYGTLKYAGTTNCDWTTGNTGNVYTAFAADTDCPTATVTGFASAPATKLAAIKFATLPPGKYLVIANGHFGPETGGVTATLRYTFSDGTSTDGFATYSINSATSTASRANSLQGFFSYAVAQTNIEFAIQAASTSNTNDPFINNATATIEWLEFQVYRFPDTTELAFKPDVASFFVQGYISGAIISLATTDQASLQQIEDTGLTLTNVVGSANVPCASGTAPSGTTCTAAAENLGVSFVAPRAGRLEICFDFPYEPTSIGAAEGVFTGFKIVETATTTTTAVQTGNVNKLMGSTTGSGVGGNVGPRMSTSLCDTFAVSSAGTKVFRLNYETDVTGTIAQQVQIDADANVANPVFSYRVRYVDQQVPNPVVVNSVVNTSTGVTRVEVAELNCDAGSAINSQLGSWVSTIGNVSAGACAITLMSGVFSSAPYCTFSYRVSAFSTGLIVGGRCTTTTACTMDCEDDGSTACTDYDVIMTCVGAK